MRTRTWRRRETKRFFRPSEVENKSVERASLPASRLGNAGTEARSTKQFPGSPRLMSGFREPTGCQCSVVVLCRKPVGPIEPVRKCRIRHNSGPSQHCSTRANDTTEARRPSMVFLLVGISQPVRGLYSAGRSASSPRQFPRARIGSSQWRFSWSDGE